MNMDIIALIITFIAGGLGGAVFTHLVNRRGNKQTRELKQEEIRIKQQELRIQEERQRLEDLPEIIFGNTMLTSPLSRELKIELVNKGADCNITEIDASQINGRLMSPHLPVNFKENSSIMWEFLLPKGSAVLTQTFPTYEISFKVEDKHARIYSGVFEVKNLGRTPGITVPPLKLQ